VASCGPAKRDHPDNELSGLPIDRVTNAKKWS
jgi:hypothetical protein